MTSSPRASGFELPSASHAGPDPDEQGEAAAGEDRAAVDRREGEVALDAHHAGDVEHRAGEREGEDATRVRGGLGGTERDLERLAVEHDGLLDRARGWC